MDIIKYFIVLIIILILISAIILFYYDFNIIPNDFQKFPDNFVIRVIDGDTFQLKNNEIIRLICIDTPEKNQPNYEEAKEYLESLILYKEIRLEKDISNKDKYNRLLRYVYINDSNNQEIFVNKELVKTGLASVFPVPPDTKRCEEIQKE